MPERVELWWARRQWSKGATVPYAIGSYRADWERYPVLVRQYHPDLNAGITLTQVPPAAEVYLVWQCDSGHRFVATPEEQRQRPGTSRRRSTWCPECAAGAVRRRVSRGRSAPGGVEAGFVGPAAIPRGAVAPAVIPSVPRPALACGHPRGPTERGRHPEGSCRICRNARAAADRFAVGESFISPWAPKPASAAEAQLRQRLSDRLEVDLGANAVRVARPFFLHLEVWPDIVITELRVAIEYDTTGRDGLEHVGRREETDRRKDRLLRAAGWEVVRIRCGRLQPIGPFDLQASGVTGATVDRVIDRLRAVRGDLIVNSYLRPDPRR
jgi:very-short-patch-repair endonuclease